MTGRQQYNEGRVRVLFPFSAVLVACGERSLFENSQRRANEEPSLTQASKGRIVQTVLKSWKIKKRKTLS
jgi:hypothetical protein